MPARWLERLSEFHFLLIHRPGSENTVAGALSRRPADRTYVGAQSFRRLFIAESAESWSTGFIRSEQGKDPAIADITRYLTAGRRPNRRDLSSAARVLLHQWDRLKVVDGVLYRLQLVQDRNIGLGWVNGGTRNHLRPSPSTF